MELTLARHAMATRFEIVLHGDDSKALRAAGEEALNEIERLEAQLSLYRPTSEVFHINARAAREPVKVSPSLFALLKHAKQLHAETDGAFNVTIAPLVRCWGFMNGDGHVPGDDEIAAARALVGLHLVRLDARELTVQFERDGVMLDLGAIGKGYAVEKAAEILRDAGIASALLHGGTSTVCAIGAPPDAEAWKIALATSPGAPVEAPAILLKDESLSVSGVRGKFFQAGDQTFGHVLDPRTGRPTQGIALAAVVLPSATETDALSTALLVAGEAGRARIEALRPGMRTVLIAEMVDQCGA